MVPMNILLDMRFPTWRNDYMRHYNMDRDRVNVIMEFEQAIWMRFQQFKIGHSALERNPKEAVCQVFEKVNTGGVALTVFELMTATFAAEDFNYEKIGKNGKRSFTPMMC